jgi:hypothetical protein
MGLHQVRRKPEPVQIQALPETGFLRLPAGVEISPSASGPAENSTTRRKLNRIAGTHAHLFAKEELDRFRREQTAANGNGQTVEGIGEEAKQAGRAAKNVDIRPPWEREFERLRDGNRKKST